MLRKEEETSKIVESKEDWKKPQDVTKQCQDLYGLPERKGVLLGGRASPGLAYDKKGDIDYGQSTRDWQRAANTSPNLEDKTKSARQSIFIMVDEKKIPLKHLLEDLYKQGGKNIQRYALVKEEEGNINFANIIGLTNFFMDYLFAKVTDEMQKIELVKHALLHLHQGGLQYALGHHILQNCNQTENKDFLPASFWRQTFTPLENGVSLLVEHRFTKMMIDRFDEVNLELDEGIHAKCKASITIHRDPSKDSDVIKINIDEAKLSLLHESVKDYIFGIGFVKNYSEKLGVLKKLYEKLYEVSDDNKKFIELDKKAQDKELEKQHVPSKRKIKVLSEVISKFRLIDLSNLEELAAFQAFLQEKMEGLNRTPESSPSYLSDFQARVSRLSIMKKLKPTSTAVLEEVSEFVSKQQKKLETPKSKNDK